MGPYMSDILTDDEFDTFLENWKDGGGEIVDFGGGVLDVEVNAVLDYVDGKPSRLQKLLRCGMRRAKNALSDMKSEVLHAYKP